VRLAVAQALGRPSIVSHDAGLVRGADRALDVVGRIAATLAGAIGVLVAGLVGRAVHVLAGVIAQALAVDRRAAGVLERGQWTAVDQVGRADLTLLADRAADGGTMALIVGRVAPRSGLRAGRQRAGRGGTAAVVD